MAPHREVSPSSMLLVANGEIPGVYPKDVKNVQEASGCAKITPGAFEVKDRSSQPTHDRDLKEQPTLFNPDFALKPRKLRVITIGAGFSGLLIAHKFQHRFPELQ